MSKRIILCLLILGLSIISASKSRDMREHRSGNTAAETPQSGRFKELGWGKNSCSKKKKRSFSRRSHVASAGINSASKSRGMREHRSGNTAAETPQQESFKELGWGKNSCSKKKKRQTNQTLACRQRRRRWRPTQLRPKHGRRRRRRLGMFLRVLRRSKE